MAAHDKAQGSRPRRLRWFSIRIAGALVIAVALALLPYRAIDSEALAMLDRMVTDVAEAEAKLTKLRAENAALRRDIRALKGDNRAIEEFARRDLGMTRPGEILYRVGTGTGERQ